MDRLTWRRLVSWLLLSSCLIAPLASAQTTPRFEVRRPLSQPSCGSVPPVPPGPRLRPAHGHTQRRCPCRRRSPRPFFQPEKSRGVHRSAQLREHGFLEDGAQSLDRRLAFLRRSSCRRAEVCLRAARIFEGPLPFADCD